MAGTDLPGFAAPDDLLIWRYTDVERLRTLVGGKLYFPSARQFDDPYEGAITETERAARIAGGFAESIPAYEELRRLTKISCWHASEYENVAMWERYRRESGYGVAIATTVGSLTRALKPFRLAPDYGEEPIRVGKVRYLDYETDSMHPRSMESVFMYKRIEYRDENEVRAVLSLRMAEEFGVQVPELGVLVDVDPEELIHEVRVWYGATDEELAYVDQVAGWKGIACQVQRSTLWRTPAY